MVAHFCFFGKENKVAFVNLRLTRGFFCIIIKNVSIFVNKYFISIAFSCRLLYNNLVFFGGELMTQKERMEKGLVYYCADEEIMGDQLLCLEKMYDFNATRPLEGQKREALLKEMFAEVGTGCYIEPPLHSNWGGKHTHLGDYVYANFNLTWLMMLTYILVAVS